DEAVRERLGRHPEGIRPYRDGLQRRAATRYARVGQGRRAVVGFDAPQYRTVCPAWARRGTVTYEEYVARQAQINASLRRVLAGILAPCRGGALTPRMWLALVALRYPVVVGC